MRLKAQRLVLVPVLLAVPFLAAQVAPSARGTLDLQRLAEERARIAAEVRAAVVVPALKELEGKGAAVEQPRERRRLRLLWERLEAEAAVRAGPAERRELLAALEEEVSRLLEKELGPAAAGGGTAASRGSELVLEAREQVRDRRRHTLQNGLKCWCPKEDWTRTIAGCWENCANEQKELIDRWLEEGFTDAEIIAEMVRRKGPRVVAVPKSFLATSAPYLILAGAGLFAAVALFRVTRRRPAREEAPARGGEEDREWEARLERELERLEEEEN
jgi:cytochrome c-type biogenesis protein CcmH/NrfF